MNSLPLLVNRLVLQASDNLQISRFRKCTVLTLFKQALSKTVQKPPFPPKLGTTSFHWNHTSHLQLRPRGQWDPRRGEGRKRQSPQRTILTNPRCIFSWRFLKERRPGLHFHFRVGLPREGDTGSENGGKGVLFSFLLLSFDHQPPATSSTKIKRTVPLQLGGLQFCRFILVPLVGSVVGPVPWKLLTGGW